MSFGNARCGYGPRVRHLVYERGDVTFELGYLEKIDLRIGLNGVFQTPRQRPALLFEGFLALGPLATHDSLVDLQPLDRALLQQLRVVRCILA